MVLPLSSPWGFDMKRYYIVFNQQGALHTRLPINADVPDPLPEGVVCVDGELWLRTINETDGIWMRGPNGAITKAPLPELKPDLARIERHWRDAELASLRWLTERHRDQLDLGLPTTLTAQHFAQLLAYLQQLRDWPQSPAYPDVEQRPVPPDWLAEQTH